MFSGKSLIELLKGIIKIIIIGFIIYNILKKEMFLMANTMYMDIGSSSVYVLNRIFTMVLQVSMYFAIIAVADFFYQRWSYEKKLKLSKDEKKEEYKQMEGDPQIKGKIKSMQRQMARSRMMQAVPEADVIIRDRKSVV